MTGSERGERTPDTILIAELIGLLNAAEHYLTAGDDARLHYLDKRASLLHRLVDAGRVPAPPGSGGEPGSRYPERAP